MHTLIEKTNFQHTDVIIVANNRQALALKRQLSTRTQLLPKILTWNSLLMHLWELSPNYQHQNLIDTTISNYIFSKIIQSSEVKFSKSLVSEVWRNYTWVKKQNIGEFKAENEMQRYFITWIQKYHTWKHRYNLIDMFDLPNIVKKHAGNYYYYGFKAQTFQQQTLFKDLKVKKLEVSENSATHFNAKTFKNIDDEIQSCTTWAKNLLDKNPEQSIVIIVPELEKYFPKFEYCFNTLFKQSFTQTKEKSFNISLGKPLTSFTIIKDLLLVLEIHLEIQNNAISTQKLLQFFNSKYIYLHRPNIVNTILKLEKEYINSTQLQKIIDIKHIKFTTKDSFDGWLKNFNQILNLFAFNQHRKMTSDEYQVWNKYKSSSIIFNKLAMFNEKISFNTALYEFKNILEQVIFNPQSGKNQIQVMGLLEAEGLQFKHSWVFGITNKVLPFSLNPLRFIPLQQCITHQVPRCDYNHINKDSASSIQSLSFTSTQPIISYSKEIDDILYMGSPLIVWNKTTQQLTKTHKKLHTLEIIADNKVQKIHNPNINKGIKTIKEQNLCSFRGFANRLDIDDFSQETTGFNSLEKGNILHTSLEIIYNNISNLEELLALENTDDLVQQSITQAMSDYQIDGFYNAVFENIFEKISAFLELEKTRDHWQVVATEHPQKVQLSTLTFLTKIDRIDENDLGEKIIFDYKLGKATNTNWCGKIKEPQLPIYMITNKKYDALSFISFKDGVRYSGMSKNPNTLTKSKLCAGKEWEEVIDFWQSTLVSVADEFADGIASVNPHKDSCEYCNLQAFCKIEKKL